MTGQLAAAALLTDGLETCLTASQRPHFGWELVASAGSEPASRYQSAYELRLSDPAGELLWDSGVVVSGGQHFVPYGGPDLAPDADYRWTVRVHDAAGVPGPWSAPQDFSTGLGAQDWDAEWIRRRPGGRAPLEILDGALRAAGSPFLPVPCPPVRSVRVEARFRPAMGPAGLLLRSTGPGTGLLLEVDAAGNVVLRRATLWKARRRPPPLPSPPPARGPAPWYSGSIRGPGTSGRSNRAPTPRSFCPDRATSRAFWPRYLDKNSVPLVLPALEFLDRLLRGFLGADETALADRGVPWAHSPLADLPQMAGMVGAKRPFSANRRLSRCCQVLLVAEAADRRRAFSHISSPTTAADSMPSAPVTTRPVRTPNSSVSQPASSPPRAWPPSSIGR